MMMMMNAPGMFIVTKILQAQIPSTCLLMQVTMTTEITENIPPSTKLFSPQDHFKPPKMCVHELPVTAINISLPVLFRNTQI